jgi:soluble lytic murein transglycosylase-like protein
MRGVWVRRRIVVALGATLVVPIVHFLSPPPAAADIYSKRDRFGVLHFTNVPTDSTYKVMMRDPIGVRASGFAIGRSGGSVDARQFDPIIADVASRYQVEQALVKAVIKAESAFRPDAISPKGARGLMQLMPATALRHNVGNVHEPSDNIRGGVQHLRMLLDRYSGNVVKAIAAYNAGEDAVDRYGGVPPYEETRNYVWRVLQFRQHFLQQAFALAR